MKPDPSRPLNELIGEHPMFKGLAPQYLALLAEVAMLKEFGSDEVIFREGDPANRFYVVLEGEIALESSRSDQSPIRLQTIGAEDVLGWSWLFPPYYWHFDARAVTPAKAIFFYGTWLRENCERDHDFGYELIKRMSAVVIQRLQTVRKRIVDLESTT